jgi:hypothetical protein
LSVGDSRESYNRTSLESYEEGVQYEDIKDLNVISLKKLVIQDLASKEAEMFMDLALQSTCEEISFDLENTDTISPSLLIHDFMRRISELDLSAGESHSIISEQLTKSLKT